MELLDRHFMKSAARVLDEEASALSAQVYDPLLKRQRIGEDFVWASPR